MTRRIVESARIDPQVLHRTVGANAQIDHVAAAIGRALHPDRRELAAVVQPQAHRGQLDLALGAQAIAPVGPDDLGRPHAALAVAAQAVRQHHAVGAVVWLDRLREAPKRDPHVGEQRAHDDDVGGLAIVSGELADEQHGSGLSVPSRRQHCTLGEHAVALLAHDEQHACEQGGGVDLLGEDHDDAVTPAELGRPPLGKVRREDPYVGTDRDGSTPRGGRHANPTRRLHALAACDEHQPDEGDAEGTNGAHDWSAESTVLWASMLHLASQTPASWGRWAVENMDEMLLDHAHCEKKAASTAVGLIFKYAHHPPLMIPLSQLAREELSHFELVIGHLRRRGLEYKRQRPSPYASRLMEIVREREPDHLLDTLLCSAMIEARSCERMRLVAEALAELPAGHRNADPQLAELYRGLLASEARHHAAYLDLARQLRLVDEVELEARLRRISDHEAFVIADAPTAPRLHNAAPVAYRTLPSAG